MPQRVFPTADIILLTREGRCSRPDVIFFAVSRPQTVVAGPAVACGAAPLNQLALAAGQTQTVLGLEVAVVCARGGLRFRLELEEGKVLLPEDAEAAP